MSTAKTIGLIGLGVALGFGGAYLVNEHRARKAAEAEAAEIEAASEPAPVIEPAAGRWDWSVARAVDAAELAAAAEPAGPGARAAVAAFMAHIRAVVEPLTIASLDRLTVAARVVVAPMPAQTMRVRPNRLREACRRALPVRGPDVSSRNTARWSAFLLPGVASG